MICLSLRHEGEELLGDVTPLVPDRQWARGIPLLHPWANRLGGFEYTFDGTTVELDEGDLYLEEHGLPLHGLRAMVAEWEISEQSPTTITSGRSVRGFAGFPFDHHIGITAELSPTGLTYTTELMAGERPVPITFGHHPFFQLPGVPRAEWEITLPVAEHIDVDERLVPTGERTPVGSLNGPLGTRTFDDGYTYAGRGPFVLAGGGLRIEVTLERGYRFAQVFAPAHADIVCFEPMTAPADGLRHAPESVPPGETHTARFSVNIVRVSDR